MAASPESTMSSDSTRGTVKVGTDTALAGLSQTLRATAKRIKTEGSRLSPGTWVWESNLHRYFIPGWRAWSIGSLNGLLLTFGGHGHGWHVKTDDLRWRIIEVAKAPAGRLLVSFFDPDGPFAGSTFDDLPNNPRNEFSASDLLAASLLDVRFEPRAVRALLEGSANSFSQYLANIPDDVDLWAATDEDLGSAYALWGK
jgi:hypothetical protein